MLDQITDSQLMTLLGQKMVNRIIDRTQNKKKDVELKTFKKYSKAYFDKKRKGNLYRQAEQFAPKKRSDVTLTLTGDMLNSLQVKEAKDTSVLIGFNPEGSIKANQNQAMGRAISTERNPVTKKDAKFIEDFFNKEITKAFEETSGTIKIDIGKIT